MLCLITSITPDGAATASIHDCVDIEAAASMYGRDDADVYVCELSLMTVYRKARAVTLTEITGERLRG